MVCLPTKPTTTGHNGPWRAECLSLAAMLVFGALVASPAWRSLWGLGVIAVLLHGLVDYPLQQRPALAGLLFAMAGMIAGSSVRPSSRIEASPGMRPPSPSLRTAPRRKLSYNP